MVVHTVRSSVGRVEDNLVLYERHASHKYPRLKRRNQTTVSNLVPGRLIKGSEVYFVTAAKHKTESEACITHAPSSARVRRRTIALI